MSKADIATMLEKRFHEHAKTVKKTILVSGGRDYPFAERVQYEIARLHSKPFATEETSRNSYRYVFGDCSTGVDAHMLELCHVVLFPYKMFKADWDVFGKFAGPIRNHQMIKIGKPDFALIFPGGKGTDNMLKQVIRAKIPYRKIEL